MSARSELGCFGTAVADAPDDDTIIADIFDHGWHVAFLCAHFYADNMGGIFNEATDLLSFALLPVVIEEPGSTGFAVLIGE